jgi:hypothetical protein
MDPTHAKHRYSIGQLVDEAYRQARHVTNNPKVMDVVATKILESWLTHSDRPGIIKRLQSF